MTLNQWRKQYANLYTSWFGNSEEVAKGWITTFGPLGFRARGLDASWPDTNFRGFFPKTLLDPNGEPVANLYMVTQVIEGSPAEKYVKEGDLILGIDGQPFKTAQSLDVLYGPYQHQDRRGLDMHAGLLVDKAEGAGKITLNLIPAENVEKIQGIQPLWKEVFREERAKKPVSLSIPVKGGQQVRLHVDDGGNGIGSDGFEWSDLRLEGPGGPVPLTKLKPLQYSVGYGAAKYDPERKVWLAHAVSSLVFDIPKGDWKLKGTGTPRRGGLRRCGCPCGRFRHPAGLREEIREKRHVQDSPAGKLRSRLPEKLRQEQGRGPHDERMAGGPAARGRLLGTPGRLLRQPLRHGLGRAGPDGHGQPEI